MWNRRNVARVDFKRTVKLLREKYFGVSANVRNVSNNTIYKSLQNKKNKP